MPRQSFNLRKVKEQKDITREIEQNENKNFSEEEKEESISTESSVVEKNNKQEEVPQERTAKSILDQIEKEKNIPRAFDVQFVPREKLIPNKANIDFAQNEIESFSESLLENGLLHNLVAIYDLEDGTYTLEAGERRYRALNMLIDKYKDYTDFEDINYIKYVKNIKMFEAGFPVNVKKKMTYTRLEEVESEIRLYSSNLDVRSDSPTKKLQQINNLNKLLEERKQLSGEAGTNTKEIAQKLKIGERQVQRYQSLNSLIPELKELFETGKVKVEEGSTYSKLTEKEQYQIVELYNNNSSKKEIQKLVDEITEANKLVSEKERLLQKAEEKQKALENKLLKTEKEAEEKIKLAREKAKSEAEQNESENISSVNKLNEKLLVKQKTLQDELDKQKSEVESYKQQLVNLQNETKAEKENINLATTLSIDETKKSLIREDAEINKLIEICTKDIISLLASVKQYEKKYDIELVDQLKISTKESIAESVDKLIKKLDTVKK